MRMNVSRGENADGKRLILSLKQTSTISGAHIILECTTLAGCRTVCIAVVALSDFSEAAIPSFALATWRTNEENASTQPQGRRQAPFNRSCGLALNLSRPNAVQDYAYQKVALILE